MDGKGMQTSKSSVGSDERLVWLKVTPEGSFWIRDGRQRADMASESEMTDGETIFPTPGTVSGIVTAALHKGKTDNSTHIIKKIEGPYLLYVVNRNRQDIFFPAPANLLKDKSGNLRYAGVFNPEVSSLTSDIRIDESPATGWIEFSLLYKMLQDPEFLLYQDNDIKGIKRQGDFFVLEDHGGVFGAEDSFLKVHGRLKKDVSFLVSVVLKNNKKDNGEDKKIIADDFFESVDIGGGGGIAVVENISDQINPTELHSVRSQKTAEEFGESFRKTCNRGSDGRYNVLMYLATPALWESGSDLGNLLPDCVEVAGMNLGAPEPVSVRHSKKRNKSLDMPGEYFTALSVPAGSLYFLKIKESEMDDFISFKRSAKMSTRADGAQQKQEAVSGALRYSRQLKSLYDATSKHFGRCGTMGFNVVMFGTYIDKKSKEEESI